MPAKHGGRAVSLTLTPKGGGSAVAITEISNYSTSDPKELVEFKSGNQNVKQHYSGDYSGTITIETSDMVKWRGFAVGQYFTAATLVAEGAADAAGTATGTNQQFILAKAVCRAKGEVSHNNDNRAPAVASLTFELTRFPEDTDDPAAPAWTDVA